MNRLSPTARSGVTLIEIMVVLLIIAIALTVLIPNFSWAANAARDAELNTTLIQAGHAQERYASKYDRYWTAGQPESLTAFGLEVPDGITLFVAIADESTYCMQASSASAPSRVFSLVAGGAIQEASCAGL